MSTDDVDKVDKLRRKHGELFTKLEDRGYDIDNLPQVTEQERDEFETVIHNANRTGKFDWSENQTNQHLVFVKTVLFISALIPLYLAGYFVVESDGLLRILVPYFFVLSLVHMYYGFRWARYVVALTSVIPVYAQLLTLDGLQATIKYFVFIVFIVLIAITINSYLLLKSKSVSQFFIWQRDCLSDSKLRKLRLLRLTIALLFIAAITADVARLVFE